MDTILRASSSPLRSPLDSLPGGWRTRRYRLARRAALGFVAMMACWQSRLADRDSLREMDAARLRDIGITRAEALGEASKPFWRA